MAKLMAAFAFGDAALFALHDEKMIAHRQQDALFPAHALLIDIDDLEKAVIVLVGAHDAPRLRPRQLPGNQIGDDFLAV